MCVGVNEGGCSGGCLCACLFLETVKRLMLCPHLLSWLRCSDRWYLGFRTQRKTIAPPSFQQLHTFPVSPNLTPTDFQHITGVITKVNINKEIKISKLKVQPTNSVLAANPKQPRVVEGMWYRATFICLCWLLSSLNPPLTVSKLEGLHEGFMFWFYGVASQSGCMGI